MQIWEHDIDDALVEQLSVGKSVQICWYFRPSSWYERDIRLQFGGLTELQP